jgi:protein-disulfide isomerase
VRHLPLTRIHAHAFPAAVAAECAAEQGRFLEMHDVLLAYQGAIGRESWRWFAGKAKIPDLDRLDECILNERYGNIVRQDLTVATQYQIGSTPTYALSGRFVESAATVVTLVESALAAIALAR